MDSPAFVPMVRKFCRFAALPRRLREGQNRHFCRKSRFANPAVKVPKIRFHVLGDFSKILIFNEISDKRRLPTRFAQNVISMQIVFSQHLHIGHGQASRLRDLQVTQHT